MKTFLKRFYIPLLAVFVVLFEELFYGILVATGTVAETGIKQNQAIVLSMLTYPLIVFDFMRGKIYRYELHVLFLLFFIILLLLITPYLFIWGAPSYRTYLLTFGSECVPAAYIGIRLARDDSWSDLGLLLPFLLIPTSLLIASIGFQYAAMNALVSGDESGLSYQSVSYFMAFGFTYFCYFMFFGKADTFFKGSVMKSMSLLMALVCGVGCLMGGGRGAMVYLLFSIMILSFYILRQTHKNRFLIFLFISVFLMLVVYIVSQTGILESAGMARIVSLIDEDETREQLYAEAWNLFLESPLWGHGVGSIWWTIGLYSHNLFLDLLAETGLLGTSVVVLVLIMTTLVLYRLSVEKKEGVLLLLIYLGALVYYTFSGYWLSAPKLFLVCTFAYCLRCKSRCG